MKDKRSFWDKIWEPDHDRHVGPVNLDALAAQESLGLPGWLHALPGRDGEIGKYQITPIMFKDLQQKMPKKYGNKFHWLTSVVDPWAEEAASDYLTIIKDRYAPHYGYEPTAENMARAYNAGPKGPLRASSSTYGASYLSWVDRIEKKK